MSTSSSRSADLTWTRGDSGRIDVVVKQANGQPFNLSGSMLFLTVKGSLTDSDSSAVIRKEVVVHDNATGGESHFDLLPGDNATSGRRVYDVQLKDSTAKVYTLFGGQWKVLGDVTTRSS